MSARGYRRQSAGASWSPVDPARPLTARSGTCAGDTHDGTGRGLPSVPGWRRAREGLMKKPHHCEASIPPAGKPRTRDPPGNQAVAAGPVRPWVRATGSPLGLHISSRPLPHVTMGGHPVLSGGSAAGAPTGRDDASVQAYRGSPKAHSLRERKPEFRGATREGTSRNCVSACTVTFVGQTSPAHPSFTEDAPQTRGMPPDTTRSCQADEPAMLSLLVCCVCLAGEGGFDPFQETTPERLAVCPRDAETRALLSGGGQGQKEPSLPAVAQSRAVLPTHGLRGAPAVSTSGAREHRARSRSAAAGDSPSVPHVEQQQRHQEFPP